MPVPALPSGGRPSDVASDVPARLADAVDAFQQVENKTRPAAALFAHQVKFHELSENRRQSPPERHQTWRGRVLRNRLSQVALHQLHHWTQEAPDAVLAVPKEGLGAAIQQQLGDVADSHLPEFTDHVYSAPHNPHDACLPHSALADLSEVLQGLKVAPGLSEPFATCVTNMAVCEIK